MANTNLEKSHELIIYIIKNLSGKITKTQLVKLMYLVDLESYRLLKSQVSNIRWKYYHYGPWDETLNLKLLSLERDGFIQIEQKSSLADDKTYFLFKFNTGHDLEYSFSPEQREIIDTIINQFGSFTLNSLLHHVYNTKEMELSKKGEYIDFAKTVKKTIKKYG